jgi:phosphatidylinositol glycan class X
MCCREIKYSLKFAPTMSCDIVLVQEIPSSVYIDNDQLFNLNKFNKIKTFIPSYIDVEAPTSKSAPFKVYMFEQIKKSVNITLPVHFRYHDPSDKKFNRVEIESPQIFFMSDCPALNKNAKATLLPCKNSSEITDFFDHTLPYYCQWSETEFHSTPITLSFLIPIGNSTSYPIVLPVTLFISWIACLFLTYVIIKKSREISKKVL